MTKTSKGDFVEIEYTGILKESKVVFDTTSEQTAKENEIHREKQKYGPVIVCIGQSNVVKGLDEDLEGKEVGVEYELMLPPENAFGKKSAKLIKLVPTSAFTKQNIRPFPGLSINIDGMFGLIKTVTGGRTIVDFNHPLSGKDIVYKYKILRIVADDREKLEAFLTTQLGIKKDAFTIEKTQAGAKIRIKAKLPKEVQDIITKQALELIPTIKKLDIAAEE